MAVFPIFGRKQKKITTLDEWRKFAPPQFPDRQWKIGRSAMELARAWVEGCLPLEVEELLQSSPITKGFVPSCAWAELQTPLDGLDGNTRTHDLVVRGHVSGLKKFILAVEGKADESFDKTIAKRLAQVERKGIPSGVPKRIFDLAQAVMHSTTNDVAGLHYQLLVVGSRHPY